MLESQLQQLANIVLANQGKILGQPEDLETTNLVDIFNAGSYWSDPISKGWNDETLPTKKGDPGRPVIPISIGSVNFNKAICNFGASVNIMPKVIYDKIFNYPLLYTTMCLQLADQSLCYTKEILEDICVRVDNSYVPADFVVIETGCDEKSPIILGRPFLNIARAIMYANTAKICFNVKGKRETFFFKDRVLQLSKKKNNRRNKNKNRKPQQMESVRLITAIHREHDHQLKSPYLLKRDDTGVPTIECTINRSSFQKVVCDTGSGVNIMAKVTYEYLYGTMPLDPTYTQLQMADQSFRFVDRIAKNVPIQIDDHFIPTDFLVIDMGENEYDPPIILGRPFLSTTKAIIYIVTGEVHFQFPIEKVRRYFNNNYIVDEEPKKNRTRRRRRNRTQKNQIPKDGWADYQGEVSRYEDRYPEEKIYLEEEVVPPIKSESVTVENKEEKIVQSTLSSKSTSPTK
jgi:hypothetical protein